MTVYFDKIDARLTNYSFEALNYARFSHDYPVYQPIVLRMAKLSKKFKAGPVIPSLTVSEI